MLQIPSDTNSRRARGTPHGALLCNASSTPTNTPQTILDIHIQTIAINWLSDGKWAGGLRKHTGWGHSCRAGYAPPMPPLCPATPLLPATRDRARACAPDETVGLRPGILDAERCLSPVPDPFSVLPRSQIQPSWGCAPSRRPSAASTAASARTRGPAQASRADGVGLCRV